MSDSALPLEDKNQVLNFIPDTSPQDYLANDKGWSLMSERMKAVIEKYPLKVLWRNVSILVEDVRLHYYLPIFPENTDVLDMGESIIAGDNFIVKVHLSLDKVKNLNFFNHDTSYSLLMHFNRS